MPGGVSGDGLDACTLATCPIEEYGLLHYLPNVPGNALYIGIFGLVLIPQIFLGLRHKTWGYLFGIFGGIILEILGYVSRILLHNNIYSLQYFIMNICCLTLGPAWFSAAIYVCLSRIIHIYGPKYSVLRPQTITVLFVSCDILAMSLQAVGGSLTSSADTKKLSDQGVDIMIAGLAFQVATTVCFVLVCAMLFFKIRRDPSQLIPEYATLRSRSSFKAFLIALGIATLTILIRCCYRLAELSQGYDSEIANDEVAFMILEGAMMIICVTALTVGHPGPILRDVWLVGKFRWSEVRQRKTTGNVVSRPPMDKLDSERSGFGSDSDKTILGEERDNMKPADELPMKA